MTDNNMFTYLLHSLNSDGIGDLIHPLTVDFEHHQEHLRFTTPTALDLTLIRDQLKQDINLLPKGFNAKQIKLFVSDMDSTLITIECIDEIADLAGVKNKVANITKQAMQGKIDFEQALRERIAHLKNVPLSCLDQVYQQRLQLTGGARELITFLQQRAIKCALVSGGFTFFTERLKTELNLDATLANELMIKDHKLIGDIKGDIVDGQAKADFVVALNHQYNIGLNNTLAIGDGANDIAMFKQAGLSIAYHAKTNVKPHADIIIDYSDLRSVLHLFNE